MQAWEHFLQKQEADLGRETVKKWLRSLKVLKFDACNLYLEAKDSFQLLWFEEHVRGQAQSFLVNGNNKAIKIHIAVANQPVITKKKSVKTGKSYPESDKPFQLTFDELDPNCTFDYFIENDDNRLAVKILQEMSDFGCKDQLSLGNFNPIYIYGAPGSGKTHLLMSLAVALRKKGLKTIYARAETFTNHVVTAIRAGQMSTFREAYRNADVLIVDDIQVFSRKGATQEEFFHTFNTLHLDGRQIILTSNCVPQELQLVEPRLTSRFEWGIVLPLKNLEGNDLEKMIEMKAKALNFPITPQIKNFLTQTFKSQPKLLIKALEALVLRLHLGREQSLHGLSIPSIKTLLGDLIQEEQKSALTHAKILQFVAEHFEIPVEDIIGKLQTKEFVLPRQIAMHLCRNKLKMPFMRIGEIFSKDHSTVMASVKYIQKSIDQNVPNIVAAWYAILKKIEF